MQPSPAVDFAAHLEDANADSVVEGTESDDVDAALAKTRGSDKDGCLSEKDSLASGSAVGAEEEAIEGGGGSVAKGMTSHDAAKGDAEEADSTGLDDDVTGLDGDFTRDDIGDASAAEPAASDSSHNAASSSITDSSPQRPTPAKGDNPPTPAGGAQGLTPAEGLEKDPQGPTPPKAEDPVYPAGDAHSPISSESLHLPRKGPTPPKVTAGLIGASRLQPTAIPMPQDSDKSGFMPKKAQESDTGMTLPDGPKKMKIFKMPIKMIRKTATALRSRPVLDDQSSKSGPSRGPIINMQAQATAPVEINGQDASGSLPPGANGAVPAVTADSEAGQERKVAAKFRKKLSQKGNKLRRFISRSKSM